jgi:hypothetical protein
MASVFRALCELPYNATSLDAMKRGALVMMDALGFKGIWRNYDSDRVLEKLSKLVQATNANLRQWTETNKLIEVNTPTPLPQATFLSDTVVISTPFVGTPGATPEADAFAEWMGVRYVAMFASILMAEALETKPRLLYRGCLTVGRFAAADAFLVGPAVDVAAELAPLAQGAFVWLDASARTALRVGPGRDFGNHLVNLIEHPVPLKGGDTLKTLAVMPFGVFHERKAREEMILQAQETLERGQDRIDVQIKAQRTLEFLRLCSESIERARIAAKFSPDGT